MFRELVADADVVVENFRPGTLERWGLGWDALSGINPRLVLVRVTGFGHSGPYRNRPGFGTLAEAMSGFAAITGAWIALHDALGWMSARNMIKTGVLRDHVAAVSCGLPLGVLAQAGVCHLLIHDNKNANC